MLFDTHAHLDDKRFDEDRDELIGSFLIGESPGHHPGMILIPLKMC